MNKGIYWKDAPEWAVAFGHTKEGLPLWIGEKGYAYCYKPNYVYEYGVTGQYREHLVEVITRQVADEVAKIGQRREEAMKNAKVGQVEYPIFKRLKGNDLVVKFTGLGKGEVVVADDERKVGDISEFWIDHTDTEAWEDWAPPHETTESTKALDTQEGGNHYKDLKIQPVEFIDANNLDYFQGNVIKYVTRHKLKNGAEDIKKAIHYCQLILQMQYGE